MQIKLEDGKNYEIYKVQRSMFNSEGVTSYLIYDEIRDEQFETTNPELCRALYTLCKAPKFFIAGELRNGQIYFKKVLKGKEWF